MTTTTEKPYAVNYWGSRPGTADDCETGADFATLDEAVAAFEKSPEQVIDWLQADGPAWIELDGPGIYDVRQNPGYSAQAAQADRDAWRREQQMHAAMAFGVDGWNEFEGGNGR